MSEFNVKDAVNGIQNQLDVALTKHTAEVEKFGKASTELTGKVDELSHKFAEAQAELQDLAQKQAAGFSKGEKRAESMGESFVKSDAFNALRDGTQQKARLEVKNTILGSSGSPLDPSDIIVPSDRIAGIIPGAFRSLTLLDVIPMGATTSNQVSYTQEDAFTNNAAEQVEGASKAQSDNTFKFVEEPVRTVAHWLKLSTQVLEDAPALESYVNLRLQHGIRQRLQRQIIQGNGTSPNLAGFAASGRHTAFSPATGDSGLDSINRAKYAVIAADYAPNVVLLNPADWGAIERAKVSGGAYALGDGAAVTYVANGMIPQVWGLTVIPSNDVPSGKFFVMDSAAVQLWMRQAATVEMGYVNDDFTKNLITLRAELRAALAVYHVPAVQYGDLLV
jgi:HK97 family phage major capsid protein